MNCVMTIKVTKPQNSISYNNAKDRKLLLHAPDISYIIESASCLLFSSSCCYQVPSCISAGSMRLHASNPNLSSVELTNEKSYHEPLDLPIDVSKLQEDFCRVANNCKRRSSQVVFENKDNIFFVVKKFKSSSTVALQEQICNRA